MMPITTAHITSNGTITPAAIAPALLSSSSGVTPVDSTLRYSLGTISGPGCPYDNNHIYTADMNIT